MALEMNLKDKVALITGVTSGIGTVIATVFSKVGACVADCGRHEAASMTTNGKGNEMDINTRK